MEIPGAVRRRDPRYFSSLGAGGNQFPEFNRWAGCGERGLKMHILRVDLLFQIAGIGIFISVLNIVLKQAGKEEQAQMLTLVGVVIVLLLVLQLLGELFSSIRDLFNLY